MANEIKRECRRHKWGDRKLGVNFFSTYTARDGSTKQAASKSCERCGRTGWFDCESGRRVRR